MALLGTNRQDEEVHEDLDGTRVIVINGDSVEYFKFPGGFKKCRDQQSRFLTTLEVIELVADLNEDGISGFGVTAMLREMNKYWDYHFFEGYPASIVINDLVEARRRLDYVIEDFRKIF